MEAQTYFYASASMRTPNIPSEELCRTFREAGNVPRLRDSPMHAGMSGLASQERKGRTDIDSSVKQPSTACGRIEQIFMNFIWDILGIVT